MRAGLSYNRATRLPPRRQVAVMAANNGANRRGVKGPDHRELFAGRKFIDQKSVGACHSCSFSELYAVIAKQSISPVQHFLDWWGREGADIVLNKNLEFIDHFRKVETGPENNIDHLFLHGGHANYDLQLLQSMGCRLDEANSDSFDHIEEQFKKLFSKREQLIQQDEPLSPEKAAQELLDSGLNELFKIAYSKGIDDQRGEVQKLASKYEIQNIALQGYTGTHYEEIKKTILAILQDAPCIANVNVSSLGGVGHAIVLVGYNPYQDCFYVKDSASKQGFQKVDAGFFIGRITTLCILKEKAVPK